MTPKLTLVSHALCPYVQRVAIVLAEKHLAVERVEIDLSNKPDWFLAISPMGKTPVLLIDGQAIFESAAICEYLEDSYGPQMHPQAPLARAQHRAWVEFASATLNSIAGLYNADNDAMLALKTEDLRAKFAKIEAALSESDHPGPFFSGASLSLVDAAFAPVFRYFDLLDHLDGLDFPNTMHSLSRWRRALRARPSVRDAVGNNYPALLHEFLVAKNTALSRRLHGEPVNREPLVYNEVRLTRPALTAAVKSAEQPGAFA